MPGWRMGNSSSGEVMALEEPGFRMGNSSSPSSRAVGIGIGADIVPRIDLRPDLVRLALHKFGMLFDG